MRILHAAVIGHPIGHTMSPFLQKRLFALSGVHMAYQVLDVPDISASLPQLKALDFFNVTIPHKSAVIPFLDELTEKARACGSVNTVKVENGRMSGTTTDGEGCCKALAHHGLDFSGNVLLLGSGGAARALAFEIAARQMGFHLTIACREGSYGKTRALGEELAAFARSLGDRDFRIVVEKYGELEMETRERYDLLLNATSVGMYPNTGTSPVSEEVISRCNTVFDAVYNPEETELLRLSRLAGKKTVGGMEMLVYQAVAAHEFWYGASFREEDVRRLCQDAQAELDLKFGGRNTEE